MARKKKLTIEEIQEASKTRVEKFVKVNNYTWRAVK